MNRYLITFRATIILILISSTTVIGGIKLNSGSLSAVKPGQVLKIQYEYSNMKVGKNLKEEEYVNQKVKEGNEKSAGKGDAWKSGWINSRADRYQPKFEELFNKVAHVCTISQNAKDTKYTLIVKSVYTYIDINISILSSTECI